MKLDAPANQQSGRMPSLTSRPHRLLFAALIAIIVITLLKLAVDRAGQQQQQQHYSREVRALVDAAGVDNETALERFQDSLSTALAVFEAGSAKAAATAAHTAATKESIIDLIAFLAYDQVKGTDRASAHLRALVDPPLNEPVRRLADATNAATATLENDLRKNSVALAVDLAALGPGPVPVQTEFASPEQVSHNFDKALRNLGIDSTAIAVAAATDVYAISSTRIIPRLVSAMVSSASKVFTKQVTKMVSAFLAALADGPLPVGDAIGMVLVLWTVYDIYQLQPEFQQDVEKTVRSHLQEMGTAVSDQASRNARSYVNAFRDLQARIGEESLKQLSK